jgi:nucleoid-associated protein YgaU
MAIYRGSRYTNTTLTNREGKLVFKIRERRNFSLENSTVYAFTDGDTLDGLAQRFYGDSQLWWVILDANPKYKSGIEIQYGEELILPSYEEVVKVYG